MSNKGEKAAEILDLLKISDEMSLTEIQRKIVGLKFRSVTIHHLKKLRENGQVIQKDNKKYIFHSKEITKSVSLPYYGEANNQLKDN